MLSEQLLKIISCPEDGSELTLKHSTLKTKKFLSYFRHTCFINENKSLFNIEGFQNQAETTFNKRLSLKKAAKTLLPSISKNFVAKKNYKVFKNILLKNNDNPKVLVIGGGIAGSGFEHLLDERIFIVETDVSFGPKTKVIADAHCLPFKDKTFDGVIVQAVLEHVLDPKICVNEIARVIKDNGYVYAETPFMQQVHMALYDFTRFISWTS